MSHGLPSLRRCEIVRAAFFRRRGHRQRRRGVDDVGAWTTVKDTPSGHAAARAPGSCPAPARPRKSCSPNPAFAHRSSCRVASPRRREQIVSLPFVVPSGSRYRSTARRSNPTTSPGGTATGLTLTRRIQSIWRLSCGLGYDGQNCSDRISHSRRPGRSRCRESEDRSK